MLGICTHGATSCWMQICWLRWAASSLQVPLYHFTPPESYRPRGIVHFLGGAFAGATPQLLYPGLIRQLSKAGYAVISTPYAVTFRHLDCAQRVQEVCRCAAPCIAAHFQHAVHKNAIESDGDFPVDLRLAGHPGLGCILVYPCCMNKEAVCISQKLQEVNATQVDSFMEKPRQSLFPCEI